MRKAIFILLAVVLVLGVAGIGFAKEETGDRCMPSTIYGKQSGSDAGTACLVDSSGHLQTDALSTSLDGIVYIDDADWSTESSKHALVGGIYQSTPQSITDGDTGPIQVDANGKIIETNSSSIKSAVEIMDDWDSSDACKVVGTGTAGSPNSGVVTIQGASSMTAVQVGDNSSTLTVDQGTATNLKTQIYGDDTTSAINTDSSGDLQVDVLSSAAPTTTIAVKSASQLLSGGALSYTSNFAAKTKVRAVTLHAGAGISETIVLTLDSGVGANYDTVLSTETLSSETDYVYIPDSDFILNSTDELKITCTNATATTTVYVTITGETLN